MSRRAIAASKRRSTVVFNPITQISALHAVWADDPSWTKPADGAAVTSLRNAGSVGTALTILSAPIYRASASGLGNRGAIEFDGVDDGAVADIPDLTQPLKLLLVWKLVTNTAGKVLIGNGASASTGFRGSGSGWAQSFGTDLIGTTGLGTVGHVYRGNAATTSSQFWIDGTSWAGPATNGTGSMTWLKLACGGGTVTHSNFAPVQIAFAGIYASTVTDTDLAQLAADLKSYYGL